MRDPRGEIAKIVETARKRAGLSVVDFAETLNVSDVWIYRIESGKDRSAIPSAGLIQQLVKQYGADEERLMRLAKELRDEKHERKLHPAMRSAPKEQQDERPVLGSASCGPFLRGEESSDETVPVRRGWTSDKKAFWVMADGDSMTGAGIETGDRVLVEPSIEPKDGDLAVVWYEDGGATLKRWHEHPKAKQDEAFVELKPESEGHRSIKFTRSEWRHNRIHRARVAGWLPTFRSAKR